MSENNEPELSLRENAFLRAANIPILKDTNGAELEVRPVMALCRCGQSSKKPFCDGTHKKIDFNGAAAENSGNQKVYAYEGKDIDVHYSKSLCSHAAECGRKLSAVFDVSQRPWIQPDKGSVEQIKDVVRACPSGALRFSMKGEDPQQIPPDRAGISIQKDGPYWVRDIPLQQHNTGPNGSAQKYVLCRCGLSKNKPFCDGTHVEAGWQDD